MPSHIYSRVGDHEAAAGSNEAAVAADREYIAAKKPAGEYPMMYYPHNLHFLAYAHAMQGRYGDAKKAAAELADHVAPHIKHMPMLEGFMTAPDLVAVRFRRWDEILKSPKPDASMPITTAGWHFARGVAFARTGRGAEAETEKAAMLAAVKGLPADAMYGPLNKMTDVMKIATQVLDAEIALSKRDTKAAIPLLAAAAKGADALNYTEPPDWWLPPRETLGAVMLREKQYPDAERVFREELSKNPRSGRALLGLKISLEAQGKPHDARSVQSQYETAWKNADVKLSVDEL
jgi:tetratricopeptide (TPR) repeat protein